MNSPHNQSDKMSNPQPIQQAARNQESKLTLLECCAMSETLSVKTGKVPFEGWRKPVEKRLNHRNAQIAKKKPTVNAPTINFGIKKAGQPIQVPSAPLNQSGSVDSQPSSHFLTATLVASKNRLNHRYSGTFFN